MTKAIRKTLAVEAFTNPKSSTFGNKTASVLKAGYSKSYAEGFAGKVLDGVEISENVIKAFKDFVEDLPDLMQVCKKKIEQLLDEKHDISAKEYTAVLKQIVMVAGWAGVFKTKIEKSVSVVNIGIPRQKCKKCGNIMDYMKEGEE